ncbi:MAG TPA: UbiD family decarboxylase [Burkholderiales bacterium]|nr:UbiD family decarboxylase [Burkholderiales bacterium]
MYERETFRELLERLRAAGELEDIREPVDSRHIATLVDQADKALLFHDVVGYDMPVVSGILRSAKRVGISMGVDRYADIEDKLTRAIAKPIPPVYVETSATREVTHVGGDVDLFDLPVPMSSILDGGPMITAGVTIVRDGDQLNAGIYRFLLKEKNLTGIDIVTPNNLRALAHKAYEAGKPLPISISIGTHMYEFMAAGYRAPAGVDEMTIAGGLRGAPVELSMCETIDVPHIADAEIVLEAEILPTGWTWPEGRFGEFTRLMGGLHWNPLVRVKAISKRRDAIYYALHMPWEVTWLMIPTRWSQLRTAMKAAGVQVKDMNVTLGGAGSWHVVLSIKKQAGEGKNALMAALSIGDIKHAVVVDDDIDVYNALDVEWAIATRVQADRDVFIIPGARAKPLDPSLPVMPAGVVPTGAKVGIDATIPEGIPRERYERIAYAYADVAKYGNYKLDPQAVKAGERKPADKEVAEVAAKILAMIDKAPMYYAEVIEAFPGVPLQAITRAFGKLHVDEKLWQDPEGRMCVRGSKFAAVVPVRR